MGSGRIFIGRLPRGCRERDIEDFFRRCGRIRQVIVKRGYAFVDFRDDRDAAAAIHTMHGRNLMGERMTVEMASGRPRGRLQDTNHRFQRRSSSSERETYKAIINNLSSRITWKNLKDLIREEDIEALNVEAHNEHRNQGSAVFRSQRDLDRAIKRLNDKEVEGRRLEVFVADRRKRSGSRSSSDAETVKESSSPSPAPKRSNNSASGRLPRLTRRHKLTALHHRQSSRSFSPPTRGRPKSDSSSPPRTKRRRMPSSSPVPRVYESSSPRTPKHRRSGR